MQRTVSGTHGIGGSMMKIPNCLARLLRRTCRAGVLPALCATLAGPGAQAADPPDFLFPVRCEIGRDCWFFAYMDLQSGPAYRDYRCGLRTYKGHEGTDIAPVDPGARLPVVAAADGVVVGWRDGMEDSPVRGLDPSRDGRECGNGVRLDHGDGWTTQYCHLQRGSVTVRQGARVSAGDELGRTGSSGLAEIPHLHFQVERNGRPIDPFAGAPPTDPPRCAASVSGGMKTALWRDSEHPAHYTPTIVHRAGLAAEVPEKERAVHGAYPSTASVTAPALVGYTVLLGAFSGTSIETVIVGPDGRILFRDGYSIDEDRARYFSYAGKRRGSANWEPGVYRAEFIVSGESPAGPFRIVSKAEITLR